MRSLFSILLFLISLGSLNAQEVPVLELSPEKSSIRIGEQIKLILKASGKFSSQDIIWPEFSDTFQLGKIELLETGTLKKDNQGDELIYTQEFLITCFDSGYYAIPPVPVNWKEDTLRSNPILIEVSTVEVDTSKGIMDIHDVRKEDLTFADQLSAWLDWLIKHWYVAVGILATIAALLYFLLRKNKPEEPKALPVPPHQWAMHQLHLLEEKRLWQSDHIKEYYVELSEIIRDYLERRFNLPALEQTTEEIKALVKLTSMNEDQQKELLSLLTLADLAKFAKQKPLPSENELALKKSRDFIRMTTPSVKKEAEDNE